ncbi:hypothetical protein GCM10028895_52220 [Pontibacter rugosus]
MAFTATSCAAQRTADASTVLQDEKRTEQIFSTILNDQELKSELMGRMMAEGNGSGMVRHMMQAAEGDTATCRMIGSMMMENPHMMDMMMGSMMDKAEGDDAMCQKMCRMMMDSDKMKGMMQQMNGQGQSPESSKTQGVAT